MNFCFVVCVLVPFCGLTVGLIKQHIYVNFDLIWNDAQKYCRRYYKDLSTITSEEENRVVIEAAGNPFSYSWIGLHKVSPVLWLWSDGQLVSFFNWQYNPPRNSSTSPNCCGMNYRGWKGYYCTEDLPFFCYRILVLVNDSKTWDRALAYCRTHYTGLAHLTYNSRIYVDKTDTNYSQTAAVWGGLRFLNRQWFWVNGEKSESLVSLHSCPAPALRCGAFNFTTNLWENRNCGEKLHFICY